MAELTLESRLTTNVNVCGPDFESTTKVNELRFDVKKGARVHIVRFCLSVIHFCYRICIIAYPIGFLRDLRNHKPLMLHSVNWEIVEVVWILVEG